MSCVRWSSVRMKISHEVSRSIGNGARKRWWRDRLIRFEENGILHKQSFPPRSSRYTSLEFLDRNLNLSFLFGLGLAMDTILGGWDKIHELGRYHSFIPGFTILFPISIYLTFVEYVWAYFYFTPIPDTRLYWGLHFRNLFQSFISQKYELVLKPCWEWLRIVILRGILWSYLWLMRKVVVLISNTIWIILISSNPVIVHFLHCIPFIYHI